MARQGTRSRLAACCSLLCLIVVGCSSGGSPSADPTPSDAGIGAQSATIGLSDGDTGDPWDDYAGAPPKVKVTQDKARTRSATIGSGGGRLLLRLAGGTTARLVIPKSALVQPTAISMTAAAIDGWTFAPAHRAAVQLKPDGLELFASARLTFTRPRVGPEGTYGDIGWSGAGRGLRPLAASKRGATVALAIDHFSGYGLVWNIESDSYWTSWRKTAQLEAEAQLESDIIAVVGVEKQKQLLGLAEGDMLDDVGSIVERWYDDVYEPLMRDGETNCEGGRRALAALLSMKRTLETLGFSVPQIYETFLVQRGPGESTQYPFDSIPDQYLDRLIDQCDEEALSACRTSGDVTLLLLYVKDRNTILTLWGKVLDETTEGERLIERCARFHADVTFGFETDVVFYDDDSPIPRDQVVRQFSIELGVDLRWKHVDGAAAWIGSVEGADAPRVTPLGNRSRQRIIVGSDSGSRDHGWGPWCSTSYTFGPWPDWRLELKSLQFRRERPRRTIMVGHLHKREVTVEGPLTTYSFEDASLLFDVFESTTARTRDTCGGSGEDPTATDVIGGFLYAQPPSTGWEFTPQGFLGPYVVILKESSSQPLTVRRDWVTGHTLEDPLAVIKGNARWEASIVLTHTPG